MFGNFSCITFSITVLLSKERKYVTKNGCQRHLRFYSYSIDESYMEYCENENSFDLFCSYEMLKVHFQFSIISTNLFSKCLCVNLKIKFELQLANCLYKYYQ